MLVLVSVLKFKMRRIDEIIIHCSATREGAEFHASDIDKWHKAKGWNGIGYHYVIALDGRVEEGRSLDKVGAHCAGHNAHSIGICYIGGVDRDGKPKDTRTSKQKAALWALLRELVVRFPNVKIHGHNYYAAKACPSFDADKEYGII